MTSTTNKLNKNRKHYLLLTAFLIEIFNIIFTQLSCTQNYLYRFHYFIKYILTLSEWKKKSFVTCCAICDHLKQISINDFIARSKHELFLFVILFLFCLFCVIKKVVYMRCNKICIVHTDRVVCLFHTDFVFKIDSFIKKSLFSVTAKRWILFR